MGLQKSVIKMSEYCLKQGSVLAPLAPDTLRLFSMRFCPYAQRTRLVLLHKKIPHETINVNLKEKPSWLFERNPSGLVPIIEYQGHVTYESTICDEYLEEKFPQPSLFPSSPELKAEQRLIMYNFDKNITAIHGLLSEKEERRLECAERLQALLENCEKFLRANRGTFMTGNKVQMIDFHFWPFFERFPAITNLRGVSLLPQARFPLLNRWMKEMKYVEAVKLTKLPDEWHQEFLLSLAQKNPQYDIGLPAVAKV